jgi:hypothetical protein
LAWSGTQHWFVTFDGRQPGYSIGANVEEMQDFLIDYLAVQNAINLDGGGSTTMVVDGSVVNCPSDGADPPCTGTPRSLPNALLLVDRNAKTAFPFSDDFDTNGRALPWDDKYTHNPVVAFSPSAPDGDGYVLEVQNPAGGYETASVAASGDANYIIEAWFYCEYRPGVAADGFERISLFARDDGNANFDSTSFGGGNCYALTYDSNDGRIRAGLIVDGVLTDFLDATPVFEPTTAWRKFQITCFGSQISYAVDDVPLADVTDATHPRGRCGIGYSEYFGNDANILGARVDRITAFKDFPGDIDDDGDVDLADFSRWTTCARGPNQPVGGNPFFPPPACRDAYDFDDDSDIDLDDFGEFQRLFSIP